MHGEVVSEVIVGVKLHSEDFFAAGMAKFQSCIDQTFSVLIFLDSTSCKYSVVLVSDMFQRQMLANTRLELSERYFSPYPNFKQPFGQHFIYISFPDNAYVFL